MQKATVILILLATLSFINQEPTLKGKWNYAGGRFNNKLSAAPKDYIQQRKYTDKSFEAWAYTKGEKDLEYEAGDYTLQGDTCLETQTFCYQDQGMIGKIVRYHYAIRNDTLVLNGTLPNGALIEDYWVRVK